VQQDYHFSCKQTFIFKNKHVSPKKWSVIDLWTKVSSLLWALYLTSDHLRIGVKLPTLNKKPYWLNYVLLSCEPRWQHKKNLTNFRQKTIAVTIISSYIGIFWVKIAKIFFPIFPAKSSNLIRIRICFQTRLRGRDPGLLRRVDPGGSQSHTVLCLNLLSWYSQGSPKLTTPTCVQIKTLISLNTTWSYYIIIYRTNHHWNYHFKWVCRWTN
jgi:hypothetical protein